MVARSEGDRPRSARLLGAYISLQEDLLGREAARQLEYTTEVSAALDESKNDCLSDWAGGRAMSYEQAVRYALSDTGSSQVGAPSCHAPSQPY